MLSDVATLHPRYALYTVNKAMRKIVRGINPPFVLGPLMGAFQDAICRKIPHLRISIPEILLHAEVGFLGLIFSILHVLELGQRLSNWSVSMDTRSWLVPLLASVGFYFHLWNSCPVNNLKYK